MPFLYHSPRPNCHRQRFLVAALHRNDRQKILVRYPLGAARGIGELFTSASFLIDSRTAIPDYVQSIDPRRLRRYARGSPPAAQGIQIGLKFQDNRAIHSIAIGAGTDVALTAPVIGQENAL